MADPGLPSFDEDDLLRLRSRIYESIGDLDALPGALMAAARRLNAAHANLVLPTFDAADGSFEDAIGGLDHAGIRTFAQESGTLDPWTEGILASRRVRPGLMLIGDQVCPRPEVLCSPWQSSVFIPQDCGDVLVAFAAPPAEQMSRVSSFTFFRSRKAPRFEPDAIDRLSLFVRDLERMGRVAFALRAELRQKALLSAALYCARDPMFILSADCTILFANAAAEAMLSRSVAFAAFGKRLIATPPTSQDRFARAVARAVEEALGSDFAIARPGARPLVATIAPMLGALPDRLEADAAALLTITDPERTLADCETIVLE